jgi:hypothetical protein
MWFRSVTPSGSGRSGDACPCGVPLLGLQSWPGSLCGSLVFADEASEDGPAVDPLPGEVRDGVVGAGRAEMAAAYEYELKQAQRHG